MTYASHRRDVTTEPNKVSLHYVKCWDSPFLLVGFRNLLMRRRRGHTRHIRIGTFSCTIYLICCMLSLGELTTFLAGGSLTVIKERTI